MATILVIDDEIANIELIKAYLALEGHEVCCAYSGIEGYEMAQTQPVDIILTDLRMPEYSWTGYDTIHHLKSTKTTNCIPVVAVTAAGDIERARDVGCDDVLNRPYKRQELYNMLERYLT